MQRRWKMELHSRLQIILRYGICTFAQGLTMTLCIYSTWLRSAAIRKKISMLPSQVTNIYSSQTGFGNSLRTYCHKVGCLYYNANYHTVDERYLLKYPVSIQSKFNSVRNEGDFTNSKKSYATVCTRLPLPLLTQELWIKANFMP